MYFAKPSCRHYYKCTNCKLIKVNNSVSIAQPSGLNFTGTSHEIPHKFGPILKESSPIPRQVTHAGYLPVSPSSLKITLLSTSCTTVFCLELVITFHDSNVCPVSTFDHDFLFIISIRILIAIY